MGHQFAFRQSGRMQTVEVDGVDVSPVIASATFKADAGKLPVIQLSLAVFDFETTTGETKIHVADGTADLLKKLGWTPPEES